MVIDQYRLEKNYMKHPSDNMDSLYRATIETIRRTIGEKRYLLGCWGIPLDGIGIMNGSRTGDDVELGWRGARRRWTPRCITISSTTSHGTVTRT